MTRMEIELPDDVAERLAQAAQAEGVAPETLAGKTVCGAFPVRRKLSFAAIGASTSGRRAADAEKTLAEEGFGIDSADR